MASSTADSSAAVDVSVDGHQQNHRDHLSMESLPLIDLRGLSQSELYSLSLCSSSSSSSVAFSSDLNRPCDVDVLIPKIDRSVFNESAGSRKQTYSRLRLAPRKPYVHSSPAAATMPRHIHEPVDEENAQIISLLKQLFGSNTPATIKAQTDDNLIPVPVDYKENLPELSTAVLQSIPIDIVSSDNDGCESIVPALVQNVSMHTVDEGNRPLDLSLAFQNDPITDVDGIVKKRKRGRPRKDQSQVVDSELHLKEVVVSKVEEAVEANEMVLENKNGCVVDLAALANMDDPFGAELRKRTEGLETKEDFLAFLSGLNGEWVSRRKKRKIVDASELGGSLPRGWKLMLCLKRHASRVWVICRRYISPYGQQFVTCKEVSLYLHSFFPLQDVSKAGSSPNEITNKLNFGNAAECAPTDDKNRDDLVCDSPLPVTSTSFDNEKQVPLWNIGHPQEVCRDEVLKCHKCSMTFDEKDNLLHHLLSSHKGNAKKWQHDASISDDAILRDGKYKCQFCHKLFEERHRYNGHLGAHIKDYMKRIETSSGSLAMPKSNFSAVSTPETSAIENSKAINSDLLARTSGVKVNDEIGSGPHSIVKEYAVPEINIEKENDELNWFSQQQGVKEDENDKTPGKESFLANYKMGKVDKATSANVDGCMVTETYISDNDNSCDSSKRTNDVKCFSNGVINKSGWESSQNCSVSLPGKGKTCVLRSSMDEVSINLVEQIKQQMGSEAGSLLQNSIENNENNENDEARLLTRTIEDMEIEHGDKVENEELDYVAVSVKQAEISQDPSVRSGIEERCSFANNFSGISSSFMVQSSQGKSSESGLPTCMDEQSVDVCCNKINEPTLGEISNLKNNEQKIEIGGNYATPCEGSLTSHEKGINYLTRSNLQSWNEKASIMENSMNVNSTNCSMEEIWQEKEIQFLSDNVEKVSYTTAEHKFNEVRNSKGSNESIIALGSRDTGADADIATSSGPERSFKESLLAPSANENFFSLNSFGDSTFEGFKRDRVSESGLLCPSGYDQACGVDNTVTKISSTTTHATDNSFWNGEVLFGYGSSQAGPNVDVTTSNMPECSKNSLVLSGNNQTFLAGNRICTSTVEDFMAKRGSENGLFGMSVTGQTQSYENQLTMGYDFKMQEGCRLGAIEDGRNNDLVIGFGNHGQHDENAMADFMWRTNEANLQQSGLANTAPSLAQPSGCFPTFDMMPNKGENEFFGMDKFGMSDFDGMRSDRIEHSEHNLMTSNRCATLGNSKAAFSYDAEMKQGFDSTSWLQKEALPLFPKLATRHQVTAVCVWCRSEFQHDAVVSETGSIGSMCETCKAKFSGQLSLF